MNKISHSKYRNSGILFELLIRQITGEMISEDNSPSIDILKKYFTNTEIAKENKLYQTLLKHQDLTEGKADTVISTVSQLSLKLDRKKLNKEKYNLIKEIKDKYDLDNFFKIPVDNYKTLASIYILIESNFVDNLSPSLIISSKMNLMEYLAAKPINRDTQIYSELSQMDKSERFLVYKIMTENFNKKYDNLDIDQKNILRNYVNNLSNPIQLKEFINKEFLKLKLSLIENNKKIDDKVTSLKINEILNLITPIVESKKMKDEYIVTLLQYQELNKELEQL